MDKISDFERQLKAAALDKDVDDFISKLERKPYTDGWKEETWQQEMEQHPFFMTKPPEPTDELPPLLQGLQQLKYDTNENSPDDLANTYKDEGNINFKAKKYDRAIINYTEGLKQTCAKEIRAQLFNNRGAAHFFLKNYSSSLKDSQVAVNLNNNYPKAEIRIIQCLFHLERYEDCISKGEAFLDKRGNNEMISELIKDARKKQKELARGIRKKLKEEEEKKSLEKRIIDEIHKRGIKIIDLVKSGGVLKSMEPLEPGYLPLRGKPVHLYENKLIWPVAFLYPEYHVVEAVTDFAEDSTFYDILKEMLSSPAEWDLDQKYKHDEITVFYVDYEDNPKKVNIQNTLASVMVEEKFAVANGTPCFFIFITGSNDERNFSKKYYPASYNLKKTEDFHVRSF